MKRLWLDLGDLGDLVKPSGPHEQWQDQQKQYEQLLSALEAMAYHIPVAISNVAALPEIADDAAIQFDPNSAKDMAEVIYKGLTNQKLRASLIKKGTQRLKCFSWQEMARKMVEIYQYVIRDA